VTEWRVRTDPQFARSQVYRRDRGVCARCGLDTEYLRQTAEWLSRLAERRWHFTKDCTGNWPRMALEYDAIKVSGDQRAAAALEQLTLAYLGYRDRRSRWSMPSLQTDHLWEADHILPVSEGGGECGLEGLRTLCLPCHRAATRQLMHRRATNGRVARGQDLERLQPTLLGVDFATDPPIIVEVPASWPRRTP